MRILFIIVIITTSMFSQDEAKNEYVVLMNDIDKVVLDRKDSLLSKTFSFYINEAYDSCYVFSERTFNKGKLTDKEMDLLNYVQGYSSMKKGLYRKGLENFKAISERSRFKNLKFFQLGTISLRLKEYRKGIFFLSEWERNNENFNLEFKNGGYHNLGLCYLHVKDFTNARKYFKKKFLLIDKKDTANVINFKMDLANVYYGQYMDDKAIPLFIESYELAKSFSSIKLKRNSAQNMAVVERNRKRYKESVGYYKEFIKWKDSIWSKDRIWQLTEKDKKMAVAQKQQEIAVQDEQIKRQKVVQKGLLFGASGLLVFLGGLAFFYRKLQGKNRLITEQKEALNVANNTKNYLFSVVSHDLRSPINSIKRQHQKLAKHIANNDLPAIKEATKSAIAVTESTSHLLNNVLHWSLEQSNMLNFSEEEHALQPVIEHVLFDYENLAEAKAISVASNLESEIIVLTDKESLKIVIRNLIDNSIKYMDGSGSISVKTEKHSETQARIEIKDSGIGISEEKLQKINALKDLSIDKIDRSKGIGLGLLLCQTLIKKNNGTLFFKSEEGASTTAVILLPLA
ncbi:tetratricopeptide repeat-containing sensor histidine kinase [Tenacibaculum ovolyticum]|uniref:tetratricopeptide repeat-containing sensor histidine kinase n=1 Tax=Tenacibaculum ovolyticum TaxID=104270 RepID=UPI0022F3FEFE|nr:tetratricopeptide repeat-containing sensor histidine kinase [Tenacibaculum ovolyticum]WBX77020.1 tetratricopeptide repeat-containing sensor histidine kinase [Tenacibaculum ovolyticum]